MGDWLDIESAPKDRKVLLYWPHKVTGAHKQAELAAMIQVDYAGSSPHRRPTHWMPLPEPPTS